jgi:hypothetical protein
MQPGKEPFDYFLIDQLSRFLAQRFSAAGIVHMGAGDFCMAADASARGSGKLDVAPVELCETSLADRVVVCSGVPAGRAEIGAFLQRLTAVAQEAHCIIVAHPENALGRDERDLGSLCREHQLPVLFEGVSTGAAPGESSPGMQICIIDRNATRLRRALPDSRFHPLAIVTTFNDEDIIEPILQRYLRDAIEVRVIDNWSSDQTVAIVDGLKHPLLKLERFPPAGPVPQFELYRLLRRKEEIALEYPGRWIIHTDSDEIRVSPWLESSLREAIFFVDRSGFNCLDFTGLEFRPIDNNFVSGTDPERYFQYFEFNRRPGAFRQQKVWKQPMDGVKLADSGGHIVEFSGKKLYPYKFLKKHYAIRSQEHGMRKILRERQPRFLQEQQTRGWHSHYRAIDLEHNFLHQPASLQKYEGPTFRRHYLLPLISGIGILD